MKFIELPAGWLKRQIASTKAEIATWPAHLRSLMEDFNDLRDMKKAEAEANDGGAEPYDQFREKELNLSQEPSRKWSASDVTDDACDAFVGAVNDCMASGDWGDVQWHRDIVASICNVMGVERPVAFDIGGLAAKILDDLKSLEFQEGDNDPRSRQEWRVGETLRRELKVIPDAKSGTELRERGDAIAAAEAKQPGEQNLLAFPVEFAKAVSACNRHGQAGPESRKLLQIGKRKEGVPSQAEMYKAMKERSRELTSVADVGEKDLLPTKSELVPTTSDLLPFPVEFAMACMPPKPKAEVPGVEK